MSDNQPNWYDIFDIVYVPFWQRTWFIVLMGLLIILLGGLVFWWYRRRLNKTIAIAYWQRVRDDLDQLAVWCSADHAEKFYIQLTTIIKKYLESRYDQPLMAKTDQELVQFVRTQNIPTHMQVLVADCIEHATYVKFANQQVVQELMQTDLRVCYQMIEYDLSQNDVDSQVSHL